MKKTAALFACCCFALTVFGQTPFTITANNFPVFNEQNFDGPNNFNGTNIVPAPNGSWDLSTYHSGNPAQNNYQIETLPFYTQAGIDVYLSDVKSLTPNLGYMIDNEIDFNATGVYEKGIYVGAQGYGLSAFTGNTQDSLTFPLQGAVYQDGRQVMQFPVSYLSGWHSQGRRVVDFNLTVTAAGLNKVPSKHVYTIFRTDTIIGWGKLRVYANGAPSIPYNVLIDRIQQHTVDSFFIGGAPAPAALLNAFGMSQGQQTAILNRYSAFREGFSTPLVVINYSNSSFQTPTAIFIDSESLTTSGVKAPEQRNYSTLLFPNPSYGGALNIQVSGNVPTISAYEITDGLGRTVQSGASNLDNGVLQLPLNLQIPNGSYLLRLLDDKKQTVIAEQFMLNQ